MNQAKIDEALLATYVAGLFGLPTAYPNMGAVDEYSNPVQPAGEPWARVSILPSRPVVATLGPGGKDEFNGVMQVDLFYPRNTGSGEANAKADEIITTFKAGTTHAAGAVTVHSDGAGRVRAVDLPDWYQTIIEIAFHSWLER